MKPTIPTRTDRRGFTLIELLVVISIIGVLAAFSIPVLSQLKLAQYKRVARAELETVQTALENYKAKYGAYPPGNQNLNSIYANNGYDASQLNQLYYELTGLTFDANQQTYTTLDGRVQIVQSSGNQEVKKAFGVDGFINVTKGAGDEVNSARNFLVTLNSRQTGLVTNNTVFPTTILITTVGGPDDGYKPLGDQNLNPIRYVYPGVKNPGSYDLWINFRFKGKTNTVCNWTRQVIVNSPVP